MQKLKLQRILLTCGILSSVLYILTDITAVAIWSKYHYTSQTVSELFAIDAPTKTFVVICFTTYALLIYAFGVGILLTAQGKRSLQVAATLIVCKEILGLIVTIFFRMHLRGVKANYSDTMHGILTAIGVFMCMFPAMIAAAITFKGKFRAYSIFTMILFIFSGVLTGLMQPKLAANLPTPLMGVLERINIYGYMVWIVILAIMLLRLQNGLFYIRTRSTNR
jgi:hypothetical protein